MPYEALPTVLKVWIDAFVQDRPLTIREALWLARLYHIFKDAGRINDIPLLTEIATDYALREKASRLTEQRADKQKDKKLHWIDDARLVELLYRDGRPMDKIVSEIKWRKLTNAEAQELGLPELFRSVMEASYEGSHSQTVQR